MLVVVCRSQVLDTHIFHSFLRDRLNRKWDAFSRMEQNTRDNAHRYNVGMALVVVAVTRQRSETLCGGSVAALWKLSKVSAAAAPAARLAWWLWLYEAVHNSLWQWS